MSEFYQEDIHMTDDIEENNFEKRFCIFKHKYVSFKNILKNIIQNFILEQRIIINNKDITNFLTIHNIMNLVVIYHDFFLCNKYSLLSTGEHILEKNSHLSNNITSLSKDDKNMYISAFIFVNSYYSLIKYDEFIQNIIDLSNYYESYCKNETKNMVSMIELEEAIDLLNI